jgi:hypothetical protein
MSVANGFSIQPPLFTEGRAPLGGRAILARPQKWLFLLILRVKSPKNEGFKATHGGSILLSLG